MHHDSIQVRIHFPTGRGDTVDFAVSVEPVRVLVPLPALDEASAEAEEFYQRLPAMIAELVEAAFSDHMKIGVTPDPFDEAG